MALKKYIFGKGNPEPNTFIGGVSATLNTPALIAAKLVIAENRIKSFKIIGNDIEFAVVGGNYDGGQWDGTSQITFFDDRLGLVKDMRSRCIRNNANLEWVNFPKLRTFIDETFIQCPKVNEFIFNSVESAYGNNGGLRINNSLTKIELNSCTSLLYPIEIFSNNPALLVLDIRKVTQLGTTQGRQPNILTNANLANLTIYANSLLQTSNNGGVEGDLAFAISGGATVIYV
jgi:hypothetical protein